MTKKLTRNDLFSLETYSEKRPEFREKVMQHKKNRQVHLGDNATLYFEDQVTIQYQIQEMLRIEKIFDAEGINEELETYNPLIPDGHNFKATFMIEYAEVEQRKEMLAKLIGIERKTWVQINDCEKVYPIANEDLERETEEKTSSVHFLRFELSDEMVKKAKTGSQISMGIDHPEYLQILDPIPENIQISLVEDLTL